MGDKTWKDTVIHNKECRANGYITGGSLGDKKLHYLCTCGRKAQAEQTWDIAYKAGQREPLSKDELILEMRREYEDKLTLAKQITREEVVDWLREEAGYGVYVKTILASRKGSAKLKDWEIK